VLWPSPLSGGIPHFLEKCGILHETLTNGFEQFDSHSEIALIIIFGVNGIIHKVTPH
jgi:hypothetical protein